jgi:hypothetical protein
VTSLDLKSLQQGILLQKKFCSRRSIDKSNNQRGTKLDSWGRVSSVVSTSMRMPCFQPPPSYYFASSFPPLMSSPPISATIFRSVSLFLFVYLIISLPVFASISTRRPTLHCFNEALCLSSNLACSPTRTHNLVFPINQDLKSTPIDLYTETPNDFPWSYTPICTETLSGLNSELCIYTNITFSSSRGISIFTTPQIARECFGLRPFQDPKALNGINNPTGPWTTRPLPGKGIGMLASVPLSHGDLITAYTPLLLVNIAHPLPTKIMESFLRRAVDQLPTASREAYLSLATQFDNPDVIVQDVLKSNAFEVQVGGMMHLAVFPEPARLNHDCAPKYVPFHIIQWELLTGKRAILSRSRAIDALCACYTRDSERRGDNYCLYVLTSFESCFPDEM